MMVLIRDQILGIMTLIPINKACSRCQTDRQLMTRHEPSSGKGQAASMKLVEFILICTFGCLASLGARASDPADDSKTFATNIRPILDRHCISCHQGEKPKGKLKLEGTLPDFSAAATRDKWSTILDRVTSREMPPKGKPQLADVELQTLSGWVGSRLKSAEAQERATQGRVVLRRLNRAEYENTMKDLFGIYVNLKAQLPEDGRADGFDNAGAANHTSSFLMEKYLEAAETALNMAISDRPKPPISTTKRHSLKDGHPVRGTTEKVYRFLENGEVVCFCSSEWHNVGATQFWPTEGGVYRFRISVSGYQSKGKPVTFRMTATGTQLTGKSGLIGYFDAPADKPTVYEIVRYMEPKTTITMLPYGLVNSDTVDKVGLTSGMALGWRCNSWMSRAR
jgi:mono/diheme cytochrome c family protein